MTSTQLDASQTQASSDAPPEPRPAGAPKWWATEADQIIQQLNTDAAHGLSAAEVARRQTESGLNQLTEPEEESFFASLINAFKDPFAIVLSFAAGISAAVGILSGTTEELQQAFWIMSIVVFMILVGWITDRSAKRQLEKIKNAQQNLCNVFRDNHTIEIDATQVVPGDILLLSQGDRVPADARVISATNASVDEAILTGESVPRPKSAAVLHEGTELAERQNMVYSGTFLNSGNIRAVVVATGMKTELGQIWERLLETEEQPTPLQDQLDVLGRLLLWGAGVTCVSILAIYVLVQGVDILDGLIIAASLAIAFIPEALGAIILIALALGVREMLQKHAIIRRLYAAEGLGSVSVVCTDKTGTITFGQMTPTRIWTPDTQSVLVQDADLQNPHPAIQRLADVVRYCNNLVGPSEVALGRLVTLMGETISARDITERVGEIPFNSARKIMTTARDENGQIVIRTKGAPTILLPRCTHILRAGERVPLADEDRQDVEAQIHAYEQEGFRVFMMAERIEASIEGEFDERYEQGLTLLGLVTLSDPARPEVAETVHTLKRAGITAKMVTGDSPVTALSIAKDIQLVPEETTIDAVVTTHEIGAMVAAARARYSANGAQQQAKHDFDHDPTAYFTPEELHRISDAPIFARVTPQDKVIIVNAQQRDNRLTAMVGDGVNDAAAIKTANVGIAMSTGADLTKDVADVILTGSYEAISSAVQVGRTILYRARLYTHALLSTNGAEVGLFIVAALAGWAIPLTAVQLLVINLAGDSWLSIALATEKEEPDVMEQQPRVATESVITPYMWMSIALQSVIVTILMATAFLFMGDYYIQSLIADGTLPAGGTVDLLSAEQAATMLILQQSAVFITFMTQKILRSAFTARSLKFNLWQIGFFSNRWSLLAAFVSVVLCLAALYLLPVGMSPVPAAVLPLLMGLGIIPPLVEELVKWIRLRTVHKGLQTPAQRAQQTQVGAAAS